MSEQHDGKAPAGLRIGLVGLDTSHCVAFAGLLNDTEAPHHVPGGRIVAAYPGGSEDFELSRSRVEGFTKQLADEHGVRILDSPAAVAEAVDLLLITAADGRAHLEQLRQTLPAGRPTFIDKPLATTLDDAQSVFRLADEAGVPVMSASALRYADPLVDALDADEGPILGCEIYGPMPEEATQPGLFWYGIHAIEMLVTVMGTGCRALRALRTDDADLITFDYGDGRLATVRGSRRGPHGFGLTLHREKRIRAIDAAAGPRPVYTGLLEAILRSLPHGESDIAAAETLEVMRLIEAANESRVSGQRVEVG